MAYNRYYPGLWKDEPNHTTPIMAAALDHIEDGLIERSLQLLQRRPLRTLRWQGWLALVR